MSTRKQMEIISWHCIGSFWFSIFLGVVVIFAMVLILMDPRFRSALYCGC